MVNLKGARVLVVVVLGLLEVVALALVELVAWLAFVASILVLVAAVVEEVAVHH